MPLACQVPVANDECGLPAAHRCSSCQRPTCADHAAPEGAGWLCPVCLAADAARQCHVCGRLAGQVCPDCGRLCCAEHAEYHELTDPETSIFKRCTVCGSVRRQQTDREVAEQVGSAPGLLAPFREAMAERGNPGVRTYQWREPRMLRSARTVSMLGWQMCSEQRDVHVAGEDGLETYTFAWVMLCDGRWITTGGGVRPEDVTGPPANQWAQVWRTMNALARDNGISWPPAT